MTACLLVAGLMGCNKTEWAGTTMKNPGEGNHLTGGFFAETQNYYYVINGVGNSTASNTFGKPVKGALVAIDKTNPDKAEVVVPKLFVASDYDAGLFIYDGYVYYGTPSTSKNSSGEIAKSDLVFTRTKLDGTNTKTYFTVSGLSTEYRIVLFGDTVHILYYDVSASALKDFNTKTGVAKTIAKTDAKTSERETLKAYSFADMGAQIVLYYTTTVYAENYFASKDSRAEETFNRVYAYKNGEVVKVLDGENTEDNQKNAIYEIVALDKNPDYELIYYKATVNSETKYYVNDFTKINTAPDEIENSSLVTDSAVIKYESEGPVVYSIEDKKVKKSYLISEGKYYDEYLTEAENANNLIDVIDGYAYYYDSTNAIARKALVEGSNEEKISEGSVTTTWYKPMLMDMGSTVVAVYCDNSTKGASYVKSVAVTAQNLVEEDTDDDQEIDSRYYKNHMFIGLVKVADQANIFKAKINEFDGKYGAKALEYTEDAQGALEFKPVQELRAEYDALDKAVKNKVDDEVIAKYEKAVVIMNLLAKVEGAGDDMVEETELNAFKTAYAEITTEIEKFIDSKDYSSVKSLLKTNALWHYQEIKELVEKDAE